MGNLQLAGCDLEEKEMDQRRKGRSKLDCFFINFVEPVFVFPINIWGHKDTCVIIYFFLKLESCWNLKNEKVY